MLIYADGYSFMLIYADYSFMLIILLTNLQDYAAMLHSFQLLSPVFEQTEAGKLPLYQLHFMLHYRSDCNVKQRLPSFWQNTRT